MTSKYLIREDSVQAYSPANHHETSNRRLIGADNVGAKNLEMILGTISRGGGALPHAHPGLEQVCYLLHGTARVEVNGEAFDMVAGDTCFFPADAMHVFSVTSDEPARVLVIYGPPYGEHPDRVRR
ncbi:cupin domain-containing protein [Alcaligenaceae bacterium LF4-65]|uniref:Cupin domain-containing protein n=1 Tax=Zwartia hollandica TaxID=324606 RepID=A0A953N609_9BURK|nr:cupin domain-containing protein [Zwartia hollandica]MBZ1349571.1 cupin domain-containing protein [Zwartia hollandica]